MSRALLWLLAATLGLWLIGPLTIGLVLGEQSILICGAIAALLCLFPSALTLILALWAQQRPPEERIVVILGSVGLRLIVVVLGGVALFFLVPLIREHRWAFLSWGLIFYLTTLVVETALVMAAFKKKEEG